MMDNKSHLAALVRLLVAVKAAGADQNPEILPAYRACINQLGYDPSKRANQNLAAIPGPAFTTSSTAHHERPGAVDFFYMLNPED